MSIVTIRPINVADILKLKKAFRRALYEDFSYFPGEYISKVERENSLSKLIKAKLSRGRMLLGIYEGRHMIGYAIADTTIATDSDIFWFYMVPEKRGQGLGRVFFSELLDIMHQHGSKHIYLITHNQRKFYEAFDFTVIGVNRGLFDGIDVYEMYKEFD